MLGTTGLMAAIGVLALGVSLPYLTDDAAAPAGPAETLMVAADGSGDYGTIAEAVTAADDGDTIRVQPGIYTEGFVIDKDITLMGDGVLDSIIIEAHEDPKMWPIGTYCGEDGVELDGCAIVLQDTSATVAGITFRGYGAGIEIAGGAPTLQGLRFEQVGPSWINFVEPVGTPIIVGGGSRATISDNEFVESGAIEIVDGSAPLISGNTLRDGATIFAFDASPETVISDNEISDPLAWAIYLGAPSSLTIEGNTFRNPATTAIAFHYGSGYSPVIRGNTFSSAPAAALVIPANSAVTIEDNLFEGNGTGVIVNDSDAQVIGNTIRDGNAGIVAVGGSAPVISGNIIDVEGRGITIGQGTNATVEGNTVCGGESSIYLAEGAEPQVLDNQICEASL
jgi:nitrous oxidase accessory protein NosD